MRIAQVAPLVESVPPKLYGGTERVVSYLTEELVRSGHDVTLFASGDSRTSAKLVPCVPRALRLDPRVRDHLPYHLIQLDRVRAQADRFDIIHFHVDLLHFPLFRRHDVPVLTTLHGRLDLPDLVPFYQAFADAPLVSISDRQRAPLLWASWVATVHHGLPLGLYEQGAGRGGYLAFLGRISPEKRPDRAIEIAERARVPLKIAAKVDAMDVSYFERTVRPRLDSPWVDYIGEIDETQKSAFLGGARALLFPIDWPEPFGLVMIEAMACGTPVIAFHGGSVEEVVEPGVTGFIVDSIDAAVAAIPRASALDRSRIRLRFEECFSVQAMAQRYLAVYRELLSNSRRGCQEVVAGQPRAADGAPHATAA